MPKFSDTEREAIAAALLQKGEQLFCEYGLRKVTVEEITKAAGIAKGSFYAFYGSKEELYFAILARCQQDMWGRMDAFLDENTALPPRALLKKAIAFIFQIIGEYPLIRRTDSETMVQLLRKLPGEVTAHHLDEDAQAVALFTRHRVVFTRPIPVVAKAFQALYGVAVMMADTEDELSAQVLDIMISGMVNELVEDTP